MSSIDIDTKTLINTFGNYIRIMYNDGEKITIKLGYCERKLITGVIDKIVGFVNIMCFSCDYEEISDLGYKPNYRKHMKLGIWVDDICDES